LINKSPPWKLEKKLKINLIKLPAPEARAQQPTDILPRERISPAEEPEYHLEAEAAEKLTTALKETQPFQFKDIEPTPESRAQQPADIAPKERVSPADKPERHLEAEAAQELAIALEKTQPSQFKDIQPAPETRAPQSADILPRERISPAEEPEFHREAEAAQGLTTALEKTQPAGAKQNIPSPAEQIEKKLGEPAPKEPIIAENVEPHLEAQMRAQELKEAADKLAAIVEKIEPLKTKESIKHEIDTVKRSLSEPLSKEPIIAEDVEPHLEAQMRAQELKEAADKLAAIIENIEPLKVKELIKHDLAEVKQSLIEPAPKEPILAEEPERHLEIDTPQNTLVKVEKTIEQNIQKQNEIINNIQEQEAQARQELKELEQNLEKIEKQKTEITKRDNEKRLEDIAQEEKRERQELAKEYAAQVKMPEAGGDGDDEEEKKEPQQQVLPENPDQAESAEKPSVAPSQKKPSDRSEPKPKKTPKELIEPTEEQIIPPTSQKPREQLHTEPAEEYVSPETYSPGTSASTTLQGGIHTPVQGFELHGTPYETHTIQDQRTPHFKGSPSGRTPYTPSSITPSYPTSSPGGYTSYEIPTPPEPIIYGEQPQQRITETHAPEKEQPADTILSEKGAAENIYEMPPRKTINRVLKDNVDFINYLVFEQRKKPQRTTAPAPEEANATDTTLIDTEKPKRPTEPSIGKKIKTFTTNIINSIQKWFGW
jgi:hypothetical protein